ncbi:MAG: transketolase, partial [Proteobacteria bacterium]|nr:transketolase [Pseudomonadota bacterium]
MTKKEDIDRLKETARLMRINILKMLHCAKSGHTGGSLSAADILTALYFHVLRHNPKDSHWPERDRFVLSKGHAAPALYSALAMCGYFDLAELMTLRKLNSSLQGHPDMRKTNGVETSSGSLGQGLSVANGIAMGLRLEGLNANVYVMLGDGELQEGQVWEAAMTAAHYKLGKVTAIVDNNGLQIDGAVKDIMEIEPLYEKWKAFGWDVQVIDGHNFEEIMPALESAKTGNVKDKPSVIIAKTIKGKGVSFFEGVVKY